MGRPRGARNNKPKTELIVIGLEELAPTIARWELELIEPSLRGVLRSVGRQGTECDARADASA
jgi:hypothetical protein